MTFSTDSKNAISMILLNFLIGKENNITERKRIDNSLETLQFSNEFSHERFESWLIEISMDGIESDDVLPTLLINDLKKEIPNIAEYATQATLVSFTKDEVDSEDYIENFNLEFTRALIIFIGHTFALPLLRQIDSDTPNELLIERMENISNTACKHFMNTIS